MLHTKIVEYFLGLVLGDQRKKLCEQSIIMGILSFLSRSATRKRRGSSIVKEEQSIGRCTNGRILVIGFSLSMLNLNILQKQIQTTIRSYISPMFTNT